MDGLLDLRVTELKTVGKRRCRQSDIPLWTSETDVSHSPTHHLHSGTVSSTIASDSSLRSDHMNVFQSVTNTRDENLPTSVAIARDRQTLDSPKSFLVRVFEPFLKTFRKSTSPQYILHFRSGTEEMSRKLLIHESLNIGSKLTTQTMKRLDPSLPPKQGKTKKNIKFCYPTILCFPEPYNMGLGVTQWCFPASQTTLKSPWWPTSEKIAVFHVHQDGFTTHFKHPEDQFTDELFCFYEMIKNVGIEKFRF